MECVVARKAIGKFEKRKRGSPSTSEGRGAEHVLASGIRLLQPASVFEGREKEEER